MTVREKHYKKPEAADIYAGQQIKKIREKMGMSQEKFAKRLERDVNITQQQIVQYEHGRIRITIGRLAQIALALGVDVNYFIPDVFKVDDLSGMYVKDLEKKVDKLEKLFKDMRVLMERHRPDLFTRSLKSLLEE